MKFNGNKVHVVRYGNNEVLKNEIMYFTEDTNEIIETVETLKDLGEIISEDATFNAHIETTTKNVRQKIG